MNNVEQDTVETPAEQTVETESVPVKEKADDSQPQEETQVESPVEGNQPEKKVSDSVPYERFKEVNDRLKQLEQQVQPVAQPAEFAPAETENPFDEATTTGVLTLAEQAANAAWERKEAEKWVKQHADDLKDRAVDSLTKELIRQGYDRDVALTEAKKELDGRTTATKKEALAEGVQEGQQLANKKEQMGAIGTSGTNSKVDPSKLSASEYAKYYGIPQVN